MKRFSTEKLEKWVKIPFRKPLVPNGTRQIVKTWEAVRQLQNLTVIVDATPSSRRKRMLLSISDAARAPRPQGFATASWLLREFGRTHYSKTAYVNFERYPELGTLFAIGPSALRLSVSPRENSAAAAGDDVSRGDAESGGYYAL